MLGNLQTEWARLFVDGLAKSGVRHAVVSPGSRSTPWAWATLEHPKLECHSIIDERSAGFFALGLAKVSAEPVLLLCTSGSAGAHYLPALVEAQQTGVPLIALTSDRPFRLMKRGASQTIDQTHLFGGAVREFFELGAADASPAALMALQQTAAQVVWAVRRQGGGPVHVNARAEKPLEPSGARTAAERELEQRVSELVELGPTHGATGVAEPSQEDLEVLVRAIDQARHGLIVCGTIAAHDSHCVEAIRELARRTRFAVVAELQSQIGLFTAVGDSCRAVAAFSALGALGEPGPDLVLELGSPLVSRHYERFCVRLGRKRHVVSAHGWSDPTASAAHVWQADPLQLAARLAARVEAPDGERLASREQWLAACQRAEASTKAAIESVLAEEPFGEAHAARELAAALPEGSQLVIGNSLPIRALNAFSEASARQVTVVTQRGASGIDGMIAGAAGAAALGTATTLVLGDVTLAHDLGSLQLLRELKLTLVVIDNQGGRIFEHLPWGLLENAPDRQKYWTTPPELELRSLASAFGLGFSEVRAAGELGKALTEAHAKGGPQLVRVVVSPESYRRAVERVERALGER